MSPKKKEAISTFVHCGNFEASSQTVFEPRTLQVTVGPLIHYTKFLSGKFVKKIEIKF